MTSTGISDADLLAYMRGHRLAVVSTVDPLGRPQGWSRVHAVDASVLPSVPATTITFSVMANAHRIGWESAGGINHQDTQNAKGELKS